MTRPRAKTPPSGAKRGPKPKLENRPNADELLAELLDPKANLSQIATREGVTHKTLTKFRDKRVPASIRAMLQRVGNGALEAAQLDVLSRFMDSAEKSYKMLLAADRWLTDPDDPSRYNLNPRLHDVDVVYEQEVGDRVIRKTEKLSKLMADVEAGLGISIQRGETKIADPRKLLLEAAATMKPILEVYGRSTGQIKTDPAVALQVFLGSADWQATQSALVEAVREHPDAAQKIALALEEVGKK